MCWNALATLADHVFVRLELRGRSKFASQITKGKKDMCLPLSLFRIPQHRSVAEGICVDPPAGRGAEERSNKGNGVPIRESARFYISAPPRPSIDGPPLLN